MKAPKRSYTIITDMEKYRDIKILLRDKTDAAPYQYLYSVTINQKNGHVFVNVETGEHALCLSKNDTVRIDEQGFRMMGFHRDTLEDLKQFYSTLLKSKPTGHTINEVVAFEKVKRFYEPLVQVAKPIPHNTNIQFHRRVAGRKLKNVNTGELFDFKGKYRYCVPALLGINSYELEKILYRGVNCKGWQLVDK